MDTSAVQTSLSVNSMNNVVRLVKLASFDKVKQLRTVTYEAMKELGVKRDLKLARTDTPAGSDQWDTGSIILWIRKVKPDQKAAVKQVRVIDATLCSRMG